MKIQSMFQKDIDRPINGVVKVMQDDQQSLKDELSEYIITRNYGVILPHSLITTSRRLIPRPIRSASGFPASLAVVNLTF